MLRTATEAGASVVALCDTNGGMLPDWVADVVHDVVETTGVRVGIHCHNDTGCAVANTLAAVDAGATHVQGTVNGYGERTGNADLLAVVANLELKLGRQVLPDGRLADATRDRARRRRGDQRAAGVAAAVRRLVGVRPQGRPARQRHQGRPQPLPAHGPGRRRQRHAPAGLRHGRPGRRSSSRAASSASTCPATESSSPASPTGSRSWRPAGYTFEAADASFELLLAEEVEGARPAYFDVESWRVITETTPGDEAVSEATVKLRAEGVRYVVTGEGNGPVNALDHALREAIGQAFPEVAKFELIDYKVRILDQGHGTDAITRVLIETSDGSSTWVTVGVGHNVIEASWGALVDGLTFGLRKHHKG